MPELWLRYGETSVVMDIKYENLLAHIYPTPSTVYLAEQKIEDELSNMDITDNTIIVVLSESQAVMNLVDQISQRAVLKNHACIAYASRKNLVKPLKNSLRKQPYPIYEVTHASLFPLLSKYKNVLCISQARYDPLFGYCGTPTLFLRQFFPPEMSEAFYSRSNNLPNPRKKLSPLEIALQTVDNNLNANSIEVVGSPKILSLHHGAISQSFESAIRSLDLGRRTGLEMGQTTLISPSEDLEPHLTLCSSLNSLWNVTEKVEKGGLAALLSENNMGLGCEALEMYVQERLDIHKHLEEKLQYMEGLEHILFIQELRKNYDLGIISTLPEYYLLKLGLIPFRSTKECYATALSKFGRSQKILVISGADILS
ncbi:MAG: hypothetical protein WBX01_16535 [Nitrososphaeraceae archaeon]|jgi:hypothetical protein